MLQEARRAASLAAPILPRAELPAVEILSQAAADQLAVVVSLVLEVGVHQAADQLAVVESLVPEVGVHQAAACLAWAAEGCRREEGRCDGTRTDR